jgi:hypothetical protein
MNRMYPSDDEPLDTDLLRQRLEASLRRSEEAHRETVRLTTELLARLEMPSATSPTSPPSTVPGTPRPANWPSATAGAPAPTTPTAPPETRHRPTVPTAAPLPPAPPVPATPGPLARFLEDKDKVTLGVSVLGAVITVIGLVFLAVQAFSRGWLGPASAVSGAAVLCLLLIVGGFAVHRRSPDGPTAPALISVGVLGMFTDLWVLVFGLGWLDPGPGVVLVAGIAGSGMITAWVWSRQPLAVILLLAGTVFLTPAILHLLQVTDSSRLDALALTVVALIGAATTWHRAWPAAALASAVVFGIGAVVLFSTGQYTALVASALAGVAVMCLLGSSAPYQTATLSAASRWLPVSTLPVVLLIADGAGDLGMTATTVACLVVAGAPVAYAGAGAVLSGTSLRSAPDRPTDAAGSPSATRQAALCCGIAGIVALLMVRQDDPYAGGALWWMIALLSLATVLLLLSDHLPVPLVWIVFAVTLAYALPRAVPAWGPSEASPALMWPVLLLLAVPGALALSRSRSLGAPTEIAVGLAGLLLVVVSSAIPLLSVTVSDTDVAFMAGHLVTSVTWMGLGVAMLARGNGNAGLALALLAAAKLVFYDLSALSGLIQVAAFIICGAILLGAAIARERRRGAHTQPSETAPAESARSEQLAEE